MKKSIRLVEYKNLVINGASVKEVTRMLQDLELNVKEARIGKDVLLVTPELKACLDFALQQCPNDATVQEICNSIYGEVSGPDLVTE